MDDLKIMIILIEGEYARIKRNTALKMQTLLLKEFKVEISRISILTFYGLNEDYEHQNRIIEYHGREY